MRELVATGPRGSFRGVIASAVLLGVVACGGSSEGTDNDQAASQMGEDTDQPTTGSSMSSSTGTSTGAPTAGDNDDDEAPPTTTVAPADPTIEPVEPTLMSCDDRSCGEPCSCAPGLDCLVIGRVPATCDANGQCVEGPVTCDAVEADCTATCPVPRICELCADGGCAEGYVPCNVDGTCGDVEWICRDEQPRGTICRSVDDCPQIVAACTNCDDGSLACPSMQCVDGACVTEGRQCSGSYDACAGKEDGESCSLCPPNAIDCLETAELKSCQGGECLAGEPRAER